MLSSSERAEAWTGGPLVVSASPSQVISGLDRESPDPDGPRRLMASGHAGPDARAAAHLLVRWCAARVTGRPPAALRIQQRCAECGSADHGQPFLVGFPDLHISLAHRPGAVVAAVGSVPVGVDVEVPDPRLAQAIPVPDLLSPGEIDHIRESADPSMALLRLWVRKECLVKLGVATLDSLRTVDLSGTVDRQLAGGATMTRFGGLHLADWVDGATGAVVAAAGSRPPVREAFPTT